MEDQGAEGRSKLEPFPVSRSLFPARYRQPDQCISCDDQDSFETACNPIAADSYRKVFFRDRPETRMNTKHSSGDGIGDGITVTSTSQNQYSCGFHGSGDN